MLARADRQQLAHRQAAGQARRIVDRDGQPLAYSVDADTIYRRSVRHRRSRQGGRAASARRSTAATASSGRRWPSGFARKSQFAYLAPAGSPERGARASRRWTCQGVVFFKESRRYYPNKELAAHLLGYVGVDNVGLAGLEVDLRQADPRPARARSCCRPTRGASHVRRVEERRRPPGPALELTIDKYLQYIAERELRTGVEENTAAGGTAVIMNPQTGEILALANWPTFNPNDYATVADDARRNRAIQDIYEPGSTFKIVTASAAIEEKADPPDDLIDCNPGHIRFGGRVDRRHATTTGVLPFTDVIVKSSNVGAIKVGLRLGADRLGRLRQPLWLRPGRSPDFRGESSGHRLEPGRLDRSALASVSMGYQVGVTPLQMAAAASVGANGGTLVRAARRPRHHPGRAPRSGPRKVVRRAISADTAATLTEIMEAVVERGTGEAGATGGLYGRRQDRDGREARQRPVLQDRLQRVVRRVRSVAEAGADDCGRDRLAAREAAITAPGCRRRCSSESRKRPSAISALARPSTRLHPCCCVRDIPIQNPLCPDQVMDRPGRAGLHRTG